MGERGGEEEEEEEGAEWLGRRGLERSEESSESIRDGALGVRGFGCALVVCWFHMCAPSPLFVVVVVVVIIQLVNVICSL